jgi:hypothetical protein
VLRTDTVINGSCLAPGILWVAPIIVSVHRRTADSQSSRPYSYYQWPPARLQRWVGSDSTSATWSLVQSRVRWRRESRCNGSIHTTKCRKGKLDVIESSLAPYVKYVNLHCTVSMYVCVYIRPKVQVPACMVSCKHVEFIHERGPSSGTRYPVDVHRVMPREAISEPDAYGRCHCTDLPKSVHRPQVGPGTNYARERQKGNELPFNRIMATTPHRGKTR